MINFPESLGFTQRMTPIIQLPRNDDFLLWLKRDDFTGIELSGNKIRKLDFLVQQALNEKADAIMTCGGLQSNHCRATAFLGAKVDLETILYLRGVADKNPTGNYLLNILSGATLNYVTAEEYRNIDEIMQQAADRYKKEGKQVYVIPEGGSNALGAWGYCQCFSELAEQIRSQKLPIEAVAVATGSGGTHAGLLIGKFLEKSDLEIFSINVCDDADFFKNKIAGIINKFEQQYNHGIDCNENDIKIYDGFVGEGYGEISTREVEFIKQFARAYGIILDPVYTVKAFIGLEQLIKQNRLEYKGVLFIHTGGVFGIFPHAEKFV